jgi:hypothetical protein
VTNESSSPVEQIRIIGPGQTLEIGSVTPGQEERAVLAIDRDGDLTLEGVFRNREVALSIAGYVTPGQGGSRRVTIRPDGRFVLGE